MKIGELAAVSGVAASTIRFWERAELLPAPTRIGGQRRYAKEAVHMLAVLRLAQACGFTMVEMRHLLHGFSPGFKASRRWRDMTKRKEIELDAQFRELRAMKKLIAVVQKCNCDDLSDCGRLASSVMKKAATTHKA